MWKVLVDLALNYIKKNLLPRLTIHPAALALITKSVEMGEQIKDIYTDDIEDNKRQIETLWAQNCEDVLALGIRGAMPLALQNPHVRKRVLAVLSQAIDDIRKDDELLILEVVDALEAKQTGVSKAVHKAITM